MKDSGTTIKFSTSHIADGIVKEIYEILKQHEIETSLRHDIKNLIKHGRITFFPFTAKANNVNAVSLQRIDDKQIALRLYFKPENSEIEYFFNYKKEKLV